MKLKTPHQKELMQSIYQKLKEEHFEKRIEELSVKYKDKRIILYGAGYYFDTINEFFDLSKLNIIGLADIKFTGETFYSGYKTFAPNQIVQEKPDAVLVTIPDASIAEEFFHNKLFPEYGNFYYESIYEKPVKSSTEKKYIPSTQEYINEKMSDVQIFDNKYALFDKMLGEVEIKDGLYLEFGVFQGTTINYIAQQKENETIYGFDSFEGLPEDWGNIKKGTFDMGTLPDVRSNVSLVKGWFSHTLPDFITEHNKPVAFMHIDCDLYSSTRDIFEALASNILPGTVIFFDEYFNYSEWKEGEYKAFQEFCEKYFVKYKYSGICNTQVALKILEKGLSG